MLLVREVRFALLHPTPKLLSSALHCPCGTAESDAPGPKLLQVAMEHANTLLIFIYDLCLYAKI